jgi:hypothetical protein
MSRFTGPWSILAVNSPKLTKLKLTTVLDADCTHVTYAELEDPPSYAPAALYAFFLIPVVTDASFAPVRSMIFDIGPHYFKCNSCHFKAKFNPLCPPHRCQTVLKVGCGLLLVLSDPSQVFLFIGGFI